MKRTLILVWLLAPVAIIAWHYGPGQDLLERDRAGSLTRSAEAAAAQSRWEPAAARFAEAGRALPEDDRAARRRLRLAEACSRIQAGEMIEGQEQLEALLGELEKQPDDDPPLLTSVRHELATASYYAAWLMRLEGATAEEWKPEAERARQQFRLLAELPRHAEDGRAERFKKNLEATIRLEQMDLSTLKAKPLPKDCPCCKNLSQRKRKQCQSRCRRRKKGEEEEDARQLIKQTRAAGLNEREGTGS